jgi:hypothetical protein
VKRPRLSYTPKVEASDLVQLVPLETPRPLTGKERALLEFLLSGPLGRDELRAQVETALVWSQCSCGCPSVGLATGPSLRRARYRSPLKITAYQPKTRTWTEVTLHVIEGRLNELEIWGEA